MLQPPRVAAVVLAAGASSRFGSPKLLARLDGRPLLQHVLDTIAGLGFGETLIVAGPAAGLEPALVRHGERVVVNPAPERGLSSSLRVGLAALAPTVDAALILLGDQPYVRRDVIERLLERAAASPPIVVPRYADDGAPNPVLLLRTAFGLADQATGDRGLGPLLAARPDLVAEVRVEGSNPDVDTPADLEALGGAGERPGSSQSRQTAAGDRR